MINKHSEQQYLELESNFLNIFNALQSLLTITEGEDLNNDKQKLIHFKALCTRVNEISDRFSKYKKKVIKEMFNGDDGIQENFSRHNAVLDKKEYDMLIECVDHFINMWEKVDDPSPYKNLRKKITSPIRNNFQNKKGDKNESKSRD